MLNRIEKRLKEVGYEGKVSENSTLIELGGDSLMLMELIVLLEEEFQIEFDDADMDEKNFTTVENIIELIKKVQARR